MPKNDEGEFELVVGNRQLLSIVFIMFVLFGVVFSMGYFVGRNSAPEAPANRQAADPARRPAQPETARPAPPLATPAPATGGETPLEPGEAKVLTQPVSTPAPAASAPPAGEVKPAVAEAPPAAKPPEPEKPAAADFGPAGPQQGQTFLQVGAVPKAEAELIVDVLKKRGYSALVAPVVPGQPEGALWRALVGPLKDAAAIAKARSDLQAAGFKEVFVRKY